MIDQLLMTAFSDELEKIAKMSEGERKARQHRYYVENRQKMITRGRAYRAQNRAELNRKKKIYGRLVRTGAKKQRRRVRVGSMGYNYAGYK